MGNHNAVVVALKSWEKLPIVSSSKRKRGRGWIRQDPYLFTKDKALGLSAARVKEANDDGFTFDGKSYTNEGYLLLHLRCDRVQRISSGTVTHDLFVTMESANAAKEHPKPPKIVNGVETRTPFTPTSTEVAIPLFLNVGNHVLFLEGASEGGARGTINELMPDYALVTLDEDADSNSSKTTLIQTQVEIKHIVRLFDFGERVEVKIGNLSGRTGTVGDLQWRRDQCTLCIIDHVRNEVAGISFNSHSFRC